MNVPTQRLLRLLEALGHTSRFRMVLALCERERHVSDLADEVGLSQSCTTRHLQALERAQVIHTHRSGKRVLAALALEQPEVAQVAAWLRSAGASDAYMAASARPAHRAHSAEAARARTSPRAKGRDSGADAATVRVDRESSVTPPAPPPAPAAPLPRPSARVSDMDDFLL